MEPNDKIQLFENQRIRTAWDEEKEEWYFSIVDVVGVLTDSVDPTAYWRKLKQRLKAEGNETVTNCHGLKMTAHDGKKRLTDVADTEQLLRIIQSIPSPKAEPFKLWLAQVGREHIEETIDPELTIDQIAAEINVSVGYFRRMFKAQYSMSPKKYILNARIVKAKELLIGTSCLSISEIACACGFTNLYHFDRTFKVHTGCSPTEYLQTFGNNF